MPRPYALPRARARAGPATFGQARPWMQSMTSRAVDARLLTGVRSAHPRKDKGAQVITSRRTAGYVAGLAIGFTLGGTAAAQVPQELRPDPGPAGATLRPDPAPARPAASGAPAPVPA